MHGQVACLLVLQLLKSHDGAVGLQLEPSMPSPLLGRMTWGAMQLRGHAFAFGRVFNKIQMSFCACLRPPTAVVGIKWLGISSAAMPNADIEMVLGAA